MIKNFPAVEDEGRLGHVLVDPLVVQSHELVPLGADDHGVGVSGGGVGRGVGGDEGLHPAGEGLNLSFNETEDSELSESLLLLDDLWVVEVLQAETVIQSNNIFSIHDWLVWSDRNCAERDSRVLFSPRSEAD